MTFAVPFSLHFKHLSDESIELNINYKPKLKSLVDFIEEYKTHRINITISGKDIQEEENLEIVAGLLDKYKDYQLVFCIASRYNSDLEEFLQSNNIPHYYSEVITTWDRFNGFLELDVTDIFIGEDLAFSAMILSERAKKKNIALRVFCNVCQSSWAETPSIKTFFIRPEDIDLYSNFFDTFEFFYSTVSQINQFYEIYAKDKKWFGRLDEIIVGYKGETDSRFFVPDFAEKRLTCKRKCAIGIEPTCKLCDRIIELEKSLKDKDLIVQVDKI